MDEEIYRSIKKVIDYLYDDEMKNWEENDKPQEGHIFHDVAIVDNWIRNKAEDL